MNEENCLLKECYEGDKERQEKHNSLLLRTACPKHKEIAT